MRTPSLLTLGLLVQVLTGCTVLYGSPPAGQCTADLDCASEPGLQDRVCDVVQHVCIEKPEVVTPVANDDEGDGCVSTEQCTRDNSQKPSLCRSKGEPCIPLETEECNNVQGAWDDPRALFIGTVGPLTYRQLTSEEGLGVPYTKRLMQSFDLGLDEWNDRRPSGLPLSGRPLAAVHCNSNADPDQSQQVMQHLVKAVGTPVVLVSGDLDLIELAPVAAEQQVALVCIDCGAPASAVQGGEDLVWRMGPSLLDEAPLMAWRAQQLSSQIRSERALEPEAKLKVAVLYGDYPGLDELAAAFRDSLAVNGQPLAADADHLLEVRTPDPRFEHVDQIKYANQILEFLPDIILVAHGMDFATYYLPLVEEGWPVQAPRPYYVTTSAHQEVELLKPFVNDNDDLRLRISGTRLAPSDTLRDNLAGFTSRYRAKYNQTWPDNTEAGYEAFYATAYSLVVANDSNALDSGPDIASAFERLASGSPVNVGPDPIETATARLVTNSSIDLVGLSNQLDWDPETHAPLADMSIWCLSRTEEGRIKLVDDAGPRWDHVSGEVTGEYACP
jgi:hypothetical protein